MKQALSPMFKVVIASIMLTAGVTIGWPDVGRSQREPESTETLQVTKEPLTITGVLGTDSETLAEDGTYYNTHTFNGEVGQTLIIEMRSNEFDTYLLLLAPDGTVIAENDDGSDRTTNSQIAIALPETGTYTLIANSYAAEATGAYTLMLRMSTAEEMNQVALLNEADQLNQQVSQLYQEGRYATAIPLAEQILELHETVLGENHPDVAQSLNNLAELYRNQGNYVEAEPLYRRALRIWENVLGDNHPDVAAGLNNLALLYQSQGNYSAAEPLYLRSLSILEEVLGENHLYVATSLNNLAVLYRLRGNYSAAEPLLIRSLNIRETILGENDRGVAQSLNNLAILYRAQGNYSAAEPLLIRSLNIWENALGENHPDVALGLHNLAEVYRAQGNYSAAEPLLIRSLNIWENALGENHPDVATNINNLALLYQSQGDYGEAEPLYLRALSILESVLGKSHPDIATNLNNLALLNWALNQNVATAEFLQQELLVEENNLELILSTGSEDRKQAYVATLDGSTNSTISFHLQAAPTDIITANLALETILRRKGRVLDAVTDNLQQLRQNLDADSQQLLDNLQATRNQLVALRFQGIGNQHPEAYQTELTRLETEAEELANLLAQRSSEFRVKSEPVTVEAAQSQLPADGVLIEFFHYQPLNPTASSEGERWGKPRYAAYILHPDGTPYGIDLGDAESIDQAITAYLNQLQQPASLNATRAAGRNLDTLVLQPIRPHLGSAQHLLISPDGQLNLIPFAALVDENDQYLIENYTLTTLASGRDLLKLQLDRPSQQEAVIVANPDFNTANSLVAQVPAPSNTRSTTTQRSTDLATLNFASLPGTQIEAEAIAPLLPNATLLTGADATEAALTQLNAPSILHLATHGYFLNDVTPIVPSSRGGNGTIEFIPAAMPPVQEGIPLSNENPLLRSGLALANFNPPRDEPGNNDGVLSALEVSSLNLYGTDLVVLSACQTGVGDVVNGEGVYGLRRAFTLAGAESLLMSLWKVDDYGTAELMHRYYERLITENEGRSEALRQVQLELLNAPAYEHPYYWAAFMLSGDWRPLDD